MFLEDMRECLLSVKFAYASSLQQVFHRFWLWARETWVVKHESFEPVEATLAFAFWINVWRAVDVFCPSLHKWKLHGPPQRQREFKNEVRQINFNAVLTGNCDNQILFQIAFSVSFDT